MTWHMKGHIANAFASVIIMVLNMTITNIRVFGTPETRYDESPSDFLVFLMSLAWTIPGIMSSILV